MNDFDRPDGLSPEGEKALDALLGFIQYRDLRSGGGCRAFYTPEEWKARGELYGTESVLIICHDGGDLAPMCNMDYECYKLHDEMQRVMGQAGFFVQDCTGWYSAVYPVEAR
jgi:hypothetical protein